MVENKQRRASTKRVAQTIVRISGKDIDGSFKIERALVEIKGIGSILAHALTYAINKKLGIDPKSEIGSLSEDSIKNVSAVISDPEKYGIPTYMLNNRMYFENGKNVHLVGPDLTLSVRSYINREMAIRTWRGYRHQNNLKVRGQRERTTGKGSTVGVSRKRAQPSKSNKNKSKK